MRQMRVFLKLSLWRISYFLLHFSKVSFARYIILHWPCLCFSALNTGEGNAPHSSTLAWKIPWMKEPGRLQSMGLLRVRCDWATSLSLSIFLHWRRKWQPTLVFLPGESQGWESLMGCCLWGHTRLKQLSSIASIVYDEKSVVSLV